MKNPADGLGDLFDLTRGEEELFANCDEIAKRQSQQYPGVLEILVVKDPFDVTGQYLAEARPIVDERGRPAIILRFTRSGGRLFGGLTEGNLPSPATGFTRKIGIILDGWLHSAPTIQGAIYDRAEISGTFTMQEVDALVRVLDAGSLPWPIREVEFRPPRSDTQ